MTPLFIILSTACFASINIGGQIIKSDSTAPNAWPVRGIQCVQEARISTSSYTNGETAYEVKQNHVETVNEITWTEILDKRFDMLERRVKELEDAREKEVHFTNSTGTFRGDDMPFAIPRDPFNMIKPVPLNLESHEPQPKYYENKSTTESPR